VSRLLHARARGGRARGQMMEARRCWGSKSLLRYVSCIHLRLRQINAHLTGVSYVFHGGLLAPAAFEVGCVCAPGHLGFLRSVCCPCLLNGVEFRYGAHEQHDPPLPIQPTPMHNTPACSPPLTHAARHSGTRLTIHIAPQALRASAPRRASSISRCRTSSSRLFWSMQTTNNNGTNVKTRRTIHSEY
jgi:hypothetical protein